MGALFLGRTKPLGPGWGAALLRRPWGSWWTASWAWGSPVPCINGSTASRSSEAIIPFRSALVRPHPEYGIQLYCPPGQGKRWWTRVSSVESYQGCLEVWAFALWGEAEELCFLLSLEKRRLEGPLSTSGEAFKRVEPDSSLCCLVGGQEKVNWSQSGPCL